MRNAIRAPRSKCSKKQECSVSRERDTMMKGGVALAKRFVKTAAIGIFDIHARICEEVLRKKGSLPKLIAVKACVLFPSNLLTVGGRWCGDMTLFACLIHLHRCAHVPEIMLLRIYSTPKGSVDITTWRNC